MWIRLLVMKTRTAERTIGCHSAPRVTTTTSWVGDGHRRRIGGWPNISPAAGTVNTALTGGHCVLWLRGRRHPGLIVTPGGWRAGGRRGRYLGSCSSRRRGASGRAGLASAGRRRAGRDATRRLPDRLHHRAPDHLPARRATSNRQPATLFRRQALLRPRHRFRRDRDQPHGAGPVARSIRLLLSRLALEASEPHGERRPSRAAGTAPR